MSSSLTSEESQTARVLLETLIEHHASQQTIKGSYRPAELISRTFEHVISQNRFLEHFFKYVHESLSSKQGLETVFNFSEVITFIEDSLSINSGRKDEIMVAMDSFAEYMIDNFYLPLRASSAKTPQPTPASLSAKQTSSQTGTTYRVSVLRERCLIRDHHRCIISRKFDRDEAEKRLKRDADCEDDDGILLENQKSDEFDFLEVAHIIPHSFTSVLPEDSELSQSKKTALEILKIFDPDVVHLIDRPNIDSPRNALTLTLNHHRLFGEFETFFEADSTGIKHKYTIDSTQQMPFLRDSLFPVTRQLHLSPERIIDPPSPQLLAIHRAIARILKLSGARSYIENILREMEDPCVKADGSTNLERHLKFRMGGWPSPLIGL